jgi:hypothetical protein
MKIKTTKEAKGILPRTTLTEGAFPLRGAKFDTDANEDKKPQRRIRRGREEEISFPSGSSFLIYGNL